MGLIPSRAWDTEGVRSLRALNTPFLVTSDPLLAEVVSGEVATEMLAGLRDAGVVGLAMLPEGMRHPFGFKAPLLGPEDYADRAIRTPTSAMSAALFKRLGATTTDEEPDHATQAGMESGYRLDPQGTATGNVTFYPKANTLVASDKALKGLTANQREILTQAADHTRDWAIETTPTDQSAAAAFCKAGGAVVLASRPQLGELKRATAPLVAELEGDPATKKIIDEIRTLESKLPRLREAPRGPAHVEVERSRGPGRRPAEVAARSGLCHMRDAWLGRRARSLGQPVIAIPSGLGFLRLLPGVFP